jgi:hypothetical protein
MQAVFACLDGLDRIIHSTVDGDGDVMSETKQSDSTQKTVSPTGQSAYGAGSKAATEKSPASRKLLRSLPVLSLDQQAHFQDISALMVQFHNFAHRQLTFDFLTQISLCFGTFVRAFWTCLLVVHGWHDKTHAQKQGAEMHSATTFVVGDGWRMHTRSIHNTLVGLLAWHLGMHACTPNRRARTQNRQTDTNTERAHCFARSLPR